MRPDRAGWMLLDGGRVRLDCAGRQLFIAGQRAKLGGRAFDVLMALVERSDRVVLKQELHDTVWPGLVVEDNTLQVHVASLRRLLGAQAISTVSGRGYRCTLSSDPVRMPVASPKIMQPRLHGLLARERLLSRLAPGGAPITWICAGPGAGKTTLAAHYIEASGAQVIWYQVDASDADPANLFYFLSLALEDAGLDRAPRLPLLPAHGLVDPASFAPTYFRAFFAALPPGTVLVIDNFEAAQAEGFENIMRVAFEQVPASASVIVLSQMHPPPALARLLANGLIRQIGADELRYTRTESDAVILSKLPADELVMAELHTRSAGWAAGLSLMIEQLRLAGSHAPASLDDTQEAVFDYFAGEILGHCSADEQYALLLTASLPRVTTRLARGMTGGLDIGKLLERLRRRHMFVVRHADGRGSSYQYHRLFKTFLGHQARARLSSSERAEAAGRAAVLLEADGHVEDAITMYLAAESWGGALRLIALHAPRWYAQGRWRTLLEWIEAMPADLSAADPWLTYWLGMCQLWSEPGAASQTLEYAYQGFADIGDRAGQILAAGACSRACMLAADWRALDLWIDALSGLLDGDLSGMTNKVLLTGLSRLVYVALARQPTNPRLAQWAARTSALLPLETEPDDALLAAFSLLFYFTWTGQTAEGERIVREIAPMAADHRASAVSRVYWHWVYANHLLTAGDAEEAHQSIRFALDLASSNGLAIAAVIRRHRVAHLLAMGRLDEAAAELDCLATHPRVEPYFELRAWLALRRGHMRLALDEAQAALRLAQERGRTLYKLLDLALLAHISAASGAAAAALQHLQCYRDATLGMPGAFAQFQAELIEAFAALQRGERRAAWAPLRLALESGSRQRLRCFWGWDSAFMVPLLTEALQQDICVGYCRELIRAHRLAPPSPDLDHWPWPIRIRTLGRFELQVDDSPIHFGDQAQRRPIELLMMLTACGDQALAIEHLVEVMWPTPEATGHESFDMTVRRLRTLLGLDAAVQVGGGQAWLDPRFVWVDAWALYRVLDRVLSPLLLNAEAVADGQRLEAAASRVMSLCTGAFLPGANDAPWLVIQRKRLSARLQLFAHHLGRHWERQKKWDQANALYQRVLELDPLAEGFYRRQLTCLLAQGRHV